MWLGFFVTERKCLLGAPCVLYMENRNGELTPMPNEIQKTDGREATPLYMVRARMDDGRSAWVRLEGWDPNQKCQWAVVVKHKELQILLAYNGKDVLLFLGNEERGVFQFFRESWFTSEALRDTLTWNFDTFEIQGIRFRLAPGTIQADDEAEMVPIEKPQGTEDEKQKPTD